MLYFTYAIPEIALSVLQSFMVIINYVTGSKIKGIRISGNSVKVPASLSMNNKFGIKT